MAEKEKKPEPETDLYLRMDNWDEEQITKELKGELLTRLVYEVEGHHALSWLGVKELARYMSKRGEPLSIEEVRHEETADSYIFFAKAVNLSTGMSLWGCFEQSKQMSIKEYDKRGRVIGRKDVDDRFALPKGLSKAQRNALRGLEPEQMVANMIGAYLRVIKKKPALKGKPESLVSTFKEMEAKRKGAVGPEKEKREEITVTPAAVAKAMETDAALDDMAREDPAVEAELKEEEEPAEEELECPVCHKKMKSKAGLEVHLKLTPCGQKEEEGEVQSGGEESS